MSITYDWNSEAKDMLIVTFDGTWTWGDFYERIREVHKAIAAVPQKVDMLLWHKVPQPLGNPLVHFNAAAKEQPLNVRQVVIITPAYGSAFLSFLMSLASIVRKIYPTKGAVILVPSLQEAEKALGKKVEVRMEAAIL